MKKLRHCHPTYCRYYATKGRCHGNHFLAFDGLLLHLGQLATRCLILGWAFGVKLSNEDIAEIEGLENVAMATNFGTTLAANGL